MKPKINYQKRNLNYYYYKIGKYDSVYGEIEANYAKCNMPVKPDLLCRLMGLYGPDYHVEQITEEEYLRFTSVEGETEE